MQLKAAFFIALPLLAAAKTDLDGCTSTVNGPIVTWYVPGTGELCDFLDCGGGRAPVKTTVPGCPLYSGTATYSPSYLPGYGPNAQASVSGGSIGGPSPPVVTSGSEVVTASGPGVVSVTDSQTLITSSSASTTSSAGARNGTVTGAPTATPTVNAACGLDAIAPSMLLAFLAVVQLL